jgi:hypothetical protein
MDDLTIHHRLPVDPRDRVERPCVWCGQPTPITALTPFRPDLGRVPLMLVCGVLMRDAYRAWSRGEGIDPLDLPGVQRLLQLRIPQPDPL